MLYSVTRPPDYKDPFMNTHVQAADSERSRTQPLFPFLDLRTQFEGIREEVMEALTRTLQSQQFILGREV